ncbi:MAG: hypothetical protein IKG91_07825, partial [Firmicutes bacterium]|nr:hypothetical protein [Bacillota bacterium]
MLTISEELFHGITPVFQICTKARLRSEGGLDFIVIDYLQLMQGSRSR